MKKLFAILLVAVFVMQCGIKTLVVIDYYINKSFIANNLCENKENVDMHCDGKCYLQKQLDKQEQKEEKLPNILKEKSEVVYFTGFDLFSFINNIKIPDLNENYLITPYKAPLRSIFHPPPVV